MQILLTLILSTLIISALMSCYNLSTDKKEAEESNIGWYEPEDSTPREQCPCCDYISLAERENYLICPICYWEDDGQDIDQLDLPSGPNNGITLREARINFEKFGACEMEMLNNVVSKEERKKYKREVREIK